MDAFICTLLHRWTECFDCIAKESLISKDKGLASHKQQHTHQKATERGKKKTTMRGYSFKL